MEEKLEEDYDVVVDDEVELSFDEGLVGVGVVDKDDMEDVDWYR